MPPTQQPVARRFSFLEDQEYQRKNEEAAAANAAENVYKPGIKDYLLFAYFCQNVFLIGSPMLNANAVVTSWQNSETFRSECSHLDTITAFCPEQEESAKVALLLFQSALAATTIMGGVLVDTFSAPMCLLIAHCMFGFGSHLFRQATTRGIFLGSVLQGAAGELLLDSVLPICGLFGTRQNIMLLILTLFSDLSVLLYPLLLRFGPSSLLSTVHAEFYADVHTYIMYYTILSTIASTCLLPVDDNGNLMPVTVAATASVLQSKNRVPPGVLPDQVSTLRVVATEHDAEEQDEDNPSTPLLPTASPPEKQGRRLKRAPRSLWALRFTRQLRTLQFAICVTLFACCTLRTSFYLNNNQRLLATAGDSGLLTSSFMWIMALGCVFGPLGWHVNDNWDQLSSLSLLCFLTLSVNVLIAIGGLELQWVTMVIFVAGRSCVASTLLTFVAACFGLKRFPAMTVVIGLSGAFLNFLNLVIDQQTEAKLEGDYHYVNYLMIVLGVLCFLCVLLQYLFPTLREEPPESGEKIAELRRAVGGVPDWSDTAHRYAARVPVGAERQAPPPPTSSSSSAHEQPAAAAADTTRAADLVDEWEDEEEDEAADNPPRRLAGRGATR